MSSSSSTGLFLLSCLLASAHSQWVRQQDWEPVSLTAESRFNPASLFALRSSEEQPMKSPLASREAGLMMSSLASIEAQPLTRASLKRDKSQQSPASGRKRSPVPSVPDKWWTETIMRDARLMNDRMIRVNPYEYPFASGAAMGGHRSSSLSVESPEFLSFPLKMRASSSSTSPLGKKVSRKQLKKQQHRQAIKPMTPSAVAVQGPMVEMERVSANPPVFPPPSEVSLHEAPAPPASALLSGSRRQRLPSKPLALRLHPSLEAGDAPSPSSSESQPLLPDKMLGNDMMFHHNRLEDVARGGAATGNEVDDPNDEFELIK